MNGVADPKLCLLSEPYLPTAVFAEFATKLGLLVLPVIESCFDSGSLKHALAYRLLLCGDVF